MGYLVIVSKIKFPNSHHLILVDSSHCDDLVANSKAVDKSALIGGGGLEHRPVDIALHCDHHGGGGCHLWVDTVIGYDMQLKQKDITLELDQLTHSLVISAR